MILAVLLLLAQQPCGTTMDGLPTCAGQEMSAAKCLATYPPDEVGGFCEWYGHATKAEAAAFERTRGFHRVVHEDGSSDTWEPGVKAEESFGGKLKRWGWYAVGAIVTAIYIYGGGMR